MQARENYKLEDCIENPQWLSLSCHFTDTCMNESSSEYRSEVFGAVQVFVTWALAMWRYPFFFWFWNYRNWSSRVFAELPCETCLLFVAAGFILLFLLLLVVVVVVVVVVFVVFLVRVLVVAVVVAVVVLVLVAVVVVVVVVGPGDVVV